MNRHLWTVTCDYFATGEGRTLSGLITYARDAEDAVQKFEERFGERLALGAKAKEGVASDALTTAIFTEKTLSFCREHQGEAMLAMTAQVYFNLS